MRTVAILLLLPTALGRRIVTALTLWSRPEALGLVHHPLLLRLGIDRLSAQSSAQLLADRSAILEALDACVIPACATMRSVSAVKESAEKLQALLEEERSRVTTDHEEWSVATCAAQEASSAARMLSAHLRSARGVFGQLGASAPIFRSFGWSHATLLAAQLDGGETHAGWVRAHAERWTALADVCDAAFDSARVALDKGAISLSLAGALSDLECSVALREAQTSSALLHDLLDDAMASCAAEEASGDEALQVLREAVEAVEPGYLKTREEVVFVSGRGRLDAEEQQAARRAAATNYLAAKLQRGLAQMGGGASSAARAGRGEPGGTVDILQIVEEYFEVGEADWDPCMDP